MSEGQGGGGSQAPFGHIMVVGGGLIGSSVLRACRCVWGESVKLTVYDRKPEVVRYCVEEGLADGGIGGRGDDFVEGVDMILLAVPLGSYGEVLEVLSPYFREGLVVSDVGSGKRVVRDVFHRYLPEGCYGIPGHPVAGTEKVGPEFGMEDLFLDRYCVLTPSEGGDAGYEEACEGVLKFWECLGMKVRKMTPERHDMVLAMTSHLPTLISYCMVGTAKGMEDLDWSCQYFADGRAVKEGWGEVGTLDVMRYAAGGFRDLTRLASSDPVMWRDVYLCNKSPVLFALDLFLEEMKHLRQAVLRGEGDFFESYFLRSQDIRRGIEEMGQAGQFMPKEKVSKRGEEVFGRKEKGKEEKKGLSSEGESG